MSEHTDFVISMLVPEVPECRLLLGDTHGVYIPQHFAQWYADEFENIDAVDLDTILEGPNEDFYWEAWNNVLTYAVHKEDGWTLYHDGDLFLIGPSFDTEAF